MLASDKKVTYYHAFALYGGTLVGMVLIIGLYESFFFFFDEYVAN